MPTPKITLRIKDGGSSRTYRFYGKRGTEYHFLRDERTHTHAFTCSLEDWRANDFAIARDIFAQQSQLPIIPDIEDGEGNQWTPEQPAPKPAVKPTKPDAQALELQKLLEEANAKLQDNQLLLDASAKRIEELSQEKPEAENLKPESTADKKPTAKAKKAKKTPK